MYKKPFNLHNRDTYSICNSSSVIDTVERLKAISQMPEHEWLDLLEISWKDYQQFRMGFRSSPDNCLENIAHHFNIEQRDLLFGNVDFKKLAIEHDLKGPEVEDYYMVAAHSRRRTTITSIEYLEQTYGWRLKADVLKHFHIKESALQDPFAPVSMRLITDICDYLDHRQFSRNDFYAMGAYTVSGNKKSMLATLLAQTENAQNLYEHFINSLMPMFESNSYYRYNRINALECLITMESNQDISNQLGVKKLGSQNICHLKTGFCASLPGYLGLPFAKVTHTTCEHRGDDACRFHVDTSPCIVHKN